ncbi:MAG TPA: DUF11 domain-containing protein [Thermoanaerobaculia bacterium]|nr:DUF11 domain-containing protein [Thermoanaerobaculia bacterium]
MKAERIAFFPTLAAMACASAAVLAVPPSARAGAFTASADLSVTKTRTTPASTSPGGFIAYDITVTNNGPNDATNVNLTDVVPSFTTVDEGSGPAGWLCDVPVAGGTGTMTCSIASLPAGTSAGPFNLQLNVDSGDAFPVEIDNTATVSSDTSDPDTSNNSSTAATELARAPTAIVPTLSGALLGAFAVGLALAGVLLLRR